MNIMYNIVYCLPNLWIFKDLIMHFCLYNLHGGIFGEKFKTFFKICIPMFIIDLCDGEIYRFTTNRHVLLNNSNDIIILVGERAKSYTYYQILYVSYLVCHVGTHRWILKISYLLNDKRT